jgi:hypothetical protein
VIWKDVRFEALNSWFTCHSSRLANDLTKLDADDALYGVGPLVSVMWAMHEDLRSC